MLLRTSLMTLLFLLVLDAIGTAIMLKKMGDNPWLALIPFYSQYKIYRFSTQKRTRRNHLCLTISFYIFLLSAFLMAIIIFMNNTGRSALTVIESLFTDTLRVTSAHIPDEYSIPFTISVSFTFICAFFNMICRLKLQAEYCELVNISKFHLIFAFFFPRLFKIFFGIKHSEKIPEAAKERKEKKESKKAETASETDIKFKIDRKDQPYDAFVSDPSWLSPCEEEGDKLDDEETTAEVVSDISEAKKPEPETKDPEIISEDTSEKEESPESTTEEHPAAEVPDTVPVKSADIPEPAPAEEKNQSKKAPVPRKPKKKTKLKKSR